jgi:hypothetical protein
VLKAVEADSGKRIELLKVDGGATVNNFMLQFQAGTGCCLRFLLANGVSLFATYHPRLTYSPLYYLLPPLGKEESLP